MKLLWAVSTVGTGHVYRNVEIARELRSLLGPLEVTWVSGGPAAEALSHEGACLDLLPVVPIPVRDGWLDVITFARNWLGCDRQSYSVSREIITRQRPDAVLADEVPSFALAARDFGLPAVYLTDLLAFDFARPFWRSAVFNLILALGGWMIDRAVRRAYEKLDLIVLLNHIGSVPASWRRWASMHCLITAPVARKTDALALSRDQVRRELGLTPAHRLIVVTVGGSDMGRHLVRTAGQAFAIIKQAMPEAALLVVLGSMIEAEACGVAPGDGVTIRQYEPDLVSYLAASDLVICNSGLSTLTEIALRAKVPTITSPIGSHWEQEANARAAAASGYAVKIDRARLNPRTLAQAAIGILTDAGRSQRMVEAARAIEDADAASIAAKGIADLLSRHSGGIRYAGLVNERCLDNERSEVGTNIAKKP